LSLGREFPYGSNESSVGSTRFRKGSPVNKSQFIDALAAHFEGNKKAASKALDSVVDTISREVAKGEKVAITGFGAFEKAVRPSRMVRNPATGERVRAKKTAVPKFRPGAELKAVVSGAKKLPKLTVAKATSAARGGAATTTSSAKKASSSSASAAKSSPTKKSTAAKKSTASKSTAAKKSTPSKSTAKKSSSSTKTTAAKKSTPASTSTAKKTPAKKTQAKKTPAKKTAKKS